MSNVQFPTFGSITYNIERKPVFSTNVQATAQSMREVRFTNYPEPLDEWTLHFSRLLEPTDLQVMLAFFYSRGGSFDSFLFSPTTDSKVSTQLIGVGDGVTKTFAFGRAFGGFFEVVDNVVITDGMFLNGVVQSGASYLISSNTTGFNNQITFNTAPPLHASITGSYTYSWRMRFKEDLLEINNFLYLYHELKEVVLVRVTGVASNQVQGPTPVPTPASAPPTTGVGTTAGHSTTQAVGRALSSSSGTGTIHASSTMTGVGGALTKSVGTSTGFGVVFGQSTLPPFIPTPTSMTTLVARHNFGLSGSVTTITGGISAVIDQTGFNHNGAQTTAGNRPSYPSVVLNGRPAASFPATGTDAILVAAQAQINNIFAGGGEVAIVCSPTLAGPGGFGPVISKSVWQIHFDPAGNLVFDTTWSGHDCFWIYLTDGDIGFGKTMFIEAQYNSDSFSNIPTIMVNGNVKTFGSFVQPTSGWVMGDDSAFSLILGNHQAADNQAFYGFIEDDYVFSAVPTLTESANLRQYINTYWGIPITNLPGSPVPSPTPAPTPAPSGFVPTSVAELEIWYDLGDATKEIHANGTSSQFTDKSHTHNATQLTTAIQPAYVATGLNSLPCARFDGTGLDNMSTPATTAINNIWAGGATIQVVMNPNADGGSSGFGRILDKGSWYAEFNHFGVFAFVASWAGNIHYWQVSTSVQFAFGTPFILEIYYNSDSALNAPVIRFNGVVHGFSATFPPTTGTMDTDATFPLKIANSQAGDKPYHGDFSSMFVAPTQPSDANVSALRAWLATEWSIVSSGGGVTPTPTPAPVSNESTEGSSVPPLTQLIDSNHIVWTVVGGQAALNGVIDPVTNNITQLYYHNHQLYQVNTSNNWYVFSATGTRWTPTTSPLSNESPEGASVPPLTQIIDSTGVVWTVVGGQAALSGVIDQVTNNITQLYYHNHLLYQVNTSNNWYVFSPTGTRWTLTTSPITGTPTPTPVPAGAGVLSTASPLWGMNLHRDQGGIWTSTSMTQMIADLKTLFGNTRVLIRAGTAGYGGYAADVAQWQAAGFVVSSVIVDYPPWSTFANEAAAYAWAYSTAQARIALAPSVNLYEVGNEWDLEDLNNFGYVITPGDGSLPADWTAAPHFRSMVGVTAGCIAAIRDFAAAGTQVSAGPTAGWVFTGICPAIINQLASYNGRNLTPDFATLHWYRNVDGGDYGPMDAAFTGHDTYQLYRNQNMPPMYATEFSSSAAPGSGLETAAGTAITGMLDNFVAHKNPSSESPGLVGGCLYQLYKNGASDQNFYFFTSPGVISAQGTALKNWIALHGNGPSPTPTPSPPSGSGLNYMLGFKAEGGPTDPNTIQGWLGRKLDIVGNTITTTNFMQGPYSDLTGAKSFVQDMSFPLTSEFGETNHLIDMAVAASGGYDSVYASMAAAMATAPNPILSAVIAWECNAGGYHWSPGAPGSVNATPANFIAAFRRAAVILRAAIPGILIQWNVNWGSGSQASAIALYPGTYNAASNPGGVDMISMDMYQANISQYWNNNVDAPWSLSLTSGGGVNLTWLVAFAQAQGVKVCMREFGPGRNGVSQGADSNTGINDGAWMAGSFAWFNSLPTDLGRYIIMSNDAPADDIVVAGHNPAEQAAWKTSFTGTTFTGTWYKGGVVPTPTPTPTPTPVAGFGLPSAAVPSVTAMQGLGYTCAADYTFGSSTGTIKTAIANGASTDLWTYCQSAYIYGNYTVTRLNDEMEFYQRVTSANQVSIDGALDPTKQTHIMGTDHLTLRASIYSASLFAAQVARMNASGDFGSWQTGSEGGAGFDCGVRSGMLSFLRFQKYGYFEVKMQVPNSTKSGAWPAFWNIDSGQVWPPEVDILEMVINNAPDNSNNSFHGKQTNGSALLTPTDITSLLDQFGSYHGGFDQGLAPHIYACEWTKTGTAQDRWKIFVDQVLVWDGFYPWIHTDGTAAGPAAFMIDLAFGGNWPGRGGADTNSAVFPIDLNVYWMRMFTKP